MTLIRGSKGKSDITVDTSCLLAYADERCPGPFHKAIDSSR